MSVQTIQRGPKRFVSQMRAMTRGEEIVVGRFAPRKRGESDQSLQNRWQPFQAAMQSGTGNGAFSFAFVWKENFPAAGVGPDFRSDDGSFAAVADLGVTDEQVGDLHGSNGLGVLPGAFRLMMIERRFNHDVRQIVILEIERAEFGVLNPENFLFQFLQRSRFDSNAPLNFDKVVGKRCRHHDLAHVVNQSGDIVRIVGGRLYATDDFASHYRNADAMLPERTPRKGCVPGETLKIFNHRSHHRESANLPDAQIKNRVFDIIDWRAEAEIHGVDQTQQSRGETRVASDDFRNLMRVTAIAVEQFPQRVLDAAKRRQPRATANAFLNQGSTDRREFRARWSNTDLWPQGHGTHCRLIGRTDEKLKERVSFSAI